MNKDIKVGNVYSYRGLRELTVVKITKVNALCSSSKSYYNQGLEEIPLYHLKTSSMYTLIKEVGVKREASNNNS